MLSSPPLSLNMSTEDISVSECLSLNNSVNVTPNEQPLAMKLPETTRVFRLQLTRQCLFRSHLENVLNIEGQRRDFLIN